MWKSRLIWGVWLAGAAALHLFTDGYAALIVLLASILAPVAGIACNRLSAGHVTLCLSTQETAAKRAEIPGVLTARNASLFPCGRIVCDLVCANTLTGGVVTPRLVFSLPGRATEHIAFSYKSALCGRIEISVPELVIRDFFGLSAVRVPSGAKCRVVVYPDTFEPVLSVGARLGLDADGTEYSTEKPGSDPSEVFAIREYKPGDSPKSIHWKLSKKLERMMVRDPGLPLETSYMLLFETAWPTGAVRPAPEALDSLAEVFCSVAQTMADNGVHHCIGWKDNGSGLFDQTDVQSTDDLIGGIPRMLSAGFARDDVSAIDSYLQGTDNDYAHVLYFSSYIPANLPDLAAHAGRVSLFLCAGKDWPEEVCGENIRVVAFPAQGYERELGYIAI